MSSSGSCCRAEQTFTWSPPAPSEASAPESLQQGTEGRGAEGRGEEALPGRCGAQLDFEPSAVPNAGAEVLVVGSWQPPMS